MQATCPSVVEHVGSRRARSIAVVLEHVRYPATKQALPAEIALVIAIFAGWFILGSINVDFVAVV